jgi:hypothetical protein
MFNSVTNIGELFFSFRHLHLGLILTRAISVMSAYVLNTAYGQNSRRSSLTFVGDGGVLVGFHLQTASPLATTA